MGEEREFLGAILQLTRGGRPWEVADVGRRAWRRTLEHQDETTRVDGLAGGFDGVFLAL